MPDWYSTTSSSEQIMNISHQIKEYFTFNRQEQKGVFVLLFILACLILFNLFLPLLIPEHTEDFSSFEKEILEFENHVRIQDSIENKGRKHFSFFLNGKKFINAMDSNYPDHKEIKDLLIIELNSADTMSLQQLRGIGPAFARRIIWYRNRLGGFISPDQLLEVFGMDSSRFNSIRKNVTVETDSIHRINLNAVTFKRLLSHPYFPYEISRPIILYRDKHRKFKEISELKNVTGINDSVFKKIKEYVEIR
ncbi:MAG: helix-hairpin-helix domain-containing protein [Bacteroidota bacterium]|nr:helix-hairpin-helix domain-containing protein [Bacteroidota bacterium]